MNGFLATVWGRQPQPGYGTVARKHYGASRWTERYLLVDGRVPRLSGTNVDDLYFSPCLFSAPDHKSAHALASRWLHADLDEVNPRSLPAELTPTLAWQTSRGRYQALWLLDRPVNREPFEAVNQKLTYLIGADKSGWPASKVLRLPDSISTKHGTPQRVRLLRGPHPTYRYEDISALVRHVRVAGSTTTGTESLPDALPRSQDVLAKWGHRLPPIARRTLSYPEPLPQRFGYLYRLYPALFGAGLSREEVFVLVHGSVWNKWPGRPDALWADVCRGFAREHCQDSDEDPRPPNGHCQHGTGGEHT